MLSKVFPTEISPRLNENMDHTPQSGLFRPRETVSFPLFHAFPCLAVFSDSAGAPRDDASFAMSSKRIGTLGTRLS